MVVLGAHCPEPLLLVGWLVFVAFGLLGLSSAAG